MTTAKEATLHFEDSSPAQIGTSGTPNVVAAPARSALQQDFLALRRILRAAWILRLPPAIAYIDNPTW